jgi:hypothetical protein
MRVFRWALVAGLVIVFGVAVQQTLLWLGVWDNPIESQVKPLEDGEQEIAFIEPATSTDDWSRLITAIQLLEYDWPKINPTLPRLNISLSDAFPPLTAAVPEIVFQFGDAPKQKLRLRWYKISGEHDAASWVKKLRGRARPPLAVIGGATSDRAIKLAYELRNAYDGPDALETNPVSPVYLITTATAEETRSKKPVMGIYKQRTFRFSFTNQTMVESLFKFVERRQVTTNHEWARSLWVHKGIDVGLQFAPILGIAAAPRLQPYTMNAFSWLDDRYSKDMADTFQTEFKKRYPFGEFHPAAPIASGIGGFSQPSPEEQITVATFLAHPTKSHSFLALPTQTVRMRRFLINLRQRSPQDARNLVVLNGDAISFHTIYRDRDVMWNILDLPYSLVFFSHRNPVDRAAGFREEKDVAADTPGAFPPHSTSGTHDLLLFQDIFESLLYAAHDGKNLLSDPHAVRDRLRSTCWRTPAAGSTVNEPRVGNTLTHANAGGARLLFDPDGDRQRHTGEHIVWLKPSFTGDIVDLKSKISVWTIRPQENGGVWQLVDDFDVPYNQAGLAGS